MPNETHSPAADRSESEEARVRVRAAKLELLRAKLAFDAIAERSKLGEDERAEAILKALLLSSMIAKIENAQIAAVADRVEDNAGRLTVATTDLSNALDELGNAVDLVERVDAVLKVVAGIFDL